MNVRACVQRNVQVTSIYTTMPHSLKPIVWAGARGNHRARSQPRLLFLVCTIVNRNSSIRCADAHLDEFRYPVDSWFTHAPCRPVVHSEHDLHTVPAGKQALIIGRRVGTVRPGYERGAWDTPREERGKNSRAVRGWTPIHRALEYLVVLT